MKQCDLCGEESARLEEKIGNDGNFIKVCPACLWLVYDVKKEPAVTVYQRNTGWRAYDNETGEIYAIDLETAEAAIQETMAAIPGFAREDFTVTEDWPAGLL